MLYWHLRIFGFWGVPVGLKSKKMTQKNKIFEKITCFFKNREICVLTR